MAIIANLKKQENGTFEGKLKTLTINERIVVQPIEGSSDSAPDYRIKVNGFEAGAGWKETSENNNEYVSCQLDSPELPNKIFANLIEKDDKYLLIWSRKD